MITVKKTLHEQQIQTKKMKELKDQGYYVIKLVRTNKNGIPDILAIPPNSDVLFVEVKTSKESPSPLQKLRHKELKAHGIRTEVYRGEE